MTYSATAPRTIAGMSPLRLAFEADGIMTLASGVGLVALAGILDSPLGLSTPLLLGVGAFFIAYAIGVLIVATRKEIPRKPAYAIAAINAFWTVDSLITLAAGWIEPTTLGAAGVIFIAAFTALMAAAQFYTLRTDR
ncbi:hypothetical protein [Nocardia crassostreae]|uniref:hypothetical protein n=1 Tax=Nocardia crassostreae TaxID=53428 RepID=UPI000A032398|nr:hypothetical protein [Nocardia crassostreae]